MHCSSEMAFRMISGEVPFSSTARLPAKRLPIQWNLAPVWYRGGMHRKVSSWVIWWCFCSISAAWVRLRCLCRMALGKPVVPEEK